MKTKLLFCALVSLIVLEAKAWGPIGHKATALVAEAYLSPKAKAAVRDLLEGQRLVDVANWADGLRDRPEYVHTLPYHYQNTRKNMPVQPNMNMYRAHLLQRSPWEKENYQAGVVEAIAGSEKIMSDVQATRKERQSKPEHLCWWRPAKA